MKGSPKLFFIATLLLFSCAHVEPKCFNVRNGTFKTDMLDGSITKISRDGIRQTENYNNGESISEYKVEWINDCEYLLYDRHVFQGNDLIPEYNSDTLLVQITEVTADFYRVKSRFIGRDGVATFRMEILEK